MQNTRYYKENSYKISPISYNEIKDLAFENVGCEVVKFRL